LFTESGTIISAQAGTLKVGATAFNLGGQTRVYPGAVMRLLGTPSSVNTITVGSTGEIGVAGVLEVETNASVSGSSALGQAKIDVLAGGEIHVIDGLYPGLPTPFTGSHLFGLRVVNAGLIEQTSNNLTLWTGGIDSTPSSTFSVKAGTAQIDNQVAVLGNLNVTAANFTLGQNVNVWATHCCVMAP